MTWKFGLDIRVSKLTGDNEAHDFILNYGQGKSMPGGPRCLFKDKEIPCYVGSSPKASITSLMLADMLKTIDSFNVFDRTDGKKPFILLDGHHSRFELPFLDYVHHPDHEWNVCIGVPYGTHLWQVGDSEAQNGSFSIAITKAKQELYHHKPPNNKNFTSSDIIPLLNSAWPKSFARIEPTKRAIVERGWNPLNYSLLLHPEILKTKPLVQVQAVSDPINTTIESDSNQQQGDATTTNGSILSILNTSQGTAGEMVDLLVLQEMKNRGRTEAIFKRRKEQEVRSSDLKKLAMASGKLTSGILGVNENYCLDSEVRDAVSLYYEKKKAEENEKKKRKQLQIKTRNEKYLKAKKKYIDNQPLNRLELTSLLSYHRLKNDPPLGKTIAELRHQWEIRKIRTEPFCSIDASLLLIDASMENNDFLMPPPNRNCSSFGTFCSTNSTEETSEENNNLLVNTSTTSTCVNGTSTSSNARVYSCDSATVEDFFSFDDANAPSVQI